MTILFWLVRTPPAKLIAKYKLQSLGIFFKQKALVLGLEAFGARMADAHTVAINTLHDDAYNYQFLIAFPTIGMPVALFISCWAFGYDSF